jgi:PqqD family protein of HPr-rel-A system
MQSWRPNPSIVLSWRDWGGDSVVIEQRSGQTLQFDPLSAAVMACVEVGVVDLSVLSQSLAADLGIEPDAEFVESLCTVLDRLVKLGWIEPLPA